jgi:hypothetical protein
VRHALADLRTGPLPHAGLRTGPIAPTPRPDLRTRPIAATPRPDLRTRRTFSRGPIGPATGTNPRTGPGLDHLQAAWASLAAVATRAASVVGPAPRASITASTGPRGAVTRSSAALVGAAVLGASFMIDARTAGRHAGIRARRIGGRLAATTPRRTGLARVHGRRGPTRTRLGTGRLARRGAVGLARRARAP